MPKRTDRLKPMEHEMRQLETLKTLKPNVTPPEYQPLSDALLDAAIAAVEAAHALESDKQPDLEKIEMLKALANNVTVFIPD